MSTIRRPPAVGAARVLVLAVSIAGMVALLAMTRWGIGTSPDCVHYLRVARQLTGEGGIEPSEAQSIQHAPLYPFLLAAGGLLGVDPLDGARWLNAFVFAFNIFLVGFIVQRASRYAPWLGVAGSLMTLGAVPVLNAHAAALTEPLFLALFLLGFLLLGLYFERLTTGYLLGAATTSGLAALTRYAGAACIIAALCAILLVGAAPPRRRLRDAVFFGLVSSLAITAWMLRNVSVASTATNRQFFLHPVGWSHAWQALYAVSGWLLIPDSAPDLLRLAATLALASTMAVILRRRLTRDPATPPVIAILALFIGTYGAFLAVSLSFFDANIPLDDRILLPVFVSVLIVMLYLLDGMWPALRMRPAARSVFAALVLMFVAGHVVKGFEGASASYARGWGYTSLAWQQSATLAEVRTLPERTLIFSNSPEIIYLHTRRTSRLLPRRQFLMTQQPNPNVWAELAAVERELRSACGVVIYFRGLTEQKSLPDEGAVRERLSLRVLSEAADGVVLAASGCQQRAPWSQEKP